MDSTEIERTYSENSQLVMNPPYELIIFVLQQQQNQWQRFGTSKMHLSSPVALTVVLSKTVVLLLMIRCRLLLPLSDSVIVLFLLCVTFCPF